MYYEQLRDGIVEPSGLGGRGLGWALFVRKGMAAWLEDRRDNVLRHDAGPAPARGGPVPAGEAKRNEILTVWTGMVLSHVAEDMG